MRPWLQPLALQNKGREKRKKNGRGKKEEKMERKKREGRKGEGMKKGKITTAKASRGMNSMGAAGSQAAWPGGLLNTDTSSTLRA